MTNMIRAFNELTPERQSRAGGKGATLARLYQAGYPVPDGFVILPAAFAGDQLTPEAWKQVQAHVARLRHADNDMAFAIRSSALSEDSAQASFAGEFDTVLGVRTDEEVRDAIQRVRRSRQAERVRAYSQAQRLDAAHEVAVVVQRMVQADMSGVVFTTDPVTGSRRTMTGNCVHGLGERLVSGRVTGETFTLERPKGRFRGPTDLKRHAHKLYRLSGRLEKELGCPQDIEWAIADAKLFILQSRPITTLQGHNPATGEWNDSQTGDYLWSNVNFGEAVPDVMTPLTWSVIQLTLDDWVFVPGVPTVGNIGGRPYLNISVIAALFDAMGKSRRDVLKTLEATLYMRLPEETDIRSFPLSRGGFFSSLINAMRVQGKQRRGLQALSTYLEANPAWFRRTRERIQGVRDQAELITLWRDAIRPHLKQGVWCVLGSVANSANYTMQLRRELSRLAGSEDADALIANLSDGSGPVASLGPLMGMANVACGQLSKEAYLAEYGHRGPHEFELSTPRPAEDPKWFDQQLDGHRKSPADIPALLQNQRERFDAAWAHLQSRHPWKAKPLRRRIAESARRARRREAARSEYVRDRWAVRLFALRAGDLTRLQDDIFFLTVDDVLSVLAGDETAVKCIPARRDAYEKCSALPLYPAIISGRFDPFRWAADPTSRRDIFDSHAPLSAPSLNTVASSIIRGAAGAAGRVEGVVRRLDRPEDGDQLRKGEILVTAQTDIAWTPLFPRASAIITDVGAPLSHAAIVARELGVPAVVGCGDATMRLKTADRVRVDGGRGIVEVLEPA